MLHSLINRLPVSHVIIPSCIEAFSSTVRGASKYDPNAKTQAVTGRTAMSHGG